MYLIAGHQNFKNDPLASVERALAGGVTAFQLREKGSDAYQGQARIQFARELKRICQRYHVPFIINDDIDLALTIGADGIHVGQEDMPIEEVRKVVKERMFIGVSTTSVAEALAAKAEGADYIGVGPLFATASKVDAKTPIGLEGLTTIVKAVHPLPVVAIGGIKPENAALVKASGAKGVAVISAITTAEKPDQIICAFRTHFD